MNSELNSSQIINGETLILAWKEAISKQKEFVTQDGLADKIPLYHYWGQQLQLHGLSKQAAITESTTVSGQMLEGILKDLLKLFQAQLERMSGLAAELKFAGEAIRIKSIKLVPDQLLNQLFLTILTLHEKIALDRKQQRYFELFTHYFVELIYELHAYRKVESGHLSELLLILKQEREQFPKRLMFKQYAVSPEQVSILEHHPHQLLNLIVTQGLHTARFLMRCEVPFGMKGKLWDSVILAGCLQDVGLTMGWGIGTKYPNHLRGHHAELQIDRHAELGSSLLNSLKCPPPGLQLLIQQHHQPVTTRELIWSSKIPTQAEMSRVLRTIVKAVHHLYRNVIPGQHLDFMPGLPALKPMQELLSVEAVRAPQLAAPLIDIIKTSEDWHLLEHHYALMPQEINQSIKLKPNYRIDTAHDLNASTQTSNSTMSNHVPRGTKITLGNDLVREAG